MSRKQLRSLFLCSLVTWTIGNGLMPLLPVYADHLGASPAEVGYFLSLSFAALTIGTLAAGWLSDRLQRRKALIVAAALFYAPALWWMGQVSSVAQLTALTAVVWFLAGWNITLVSILTGLLAEGAQRGRVFGVLNTTIALGAIAGGLTTGWVVERWGYATLFTGLAVFSVLLLLAASTLKDKAATPRRTRAPTRTALNGSVYLMLAASVSASIALFVGRLGTSLGMNQLGFLASAISSTMAVGGLITVPLPLLVGRLSDRMGRKPLLAACYVAGAAGLSVLSIAESIGQFWMAAALLSVVGFVGSAVGSALIADLVPRESLGRGMSAFNATFWIGGIVGFAAAGYAIQTLGTPTTFAAAILVLLMAIVILIPVCQARPRTHSTDIVPWPRRQPECSINQTP
jgi:MFS family permease